MQRCGPNEHPDFTAAESEMYRSCPIVEMTEVGREVPCSMASDHQKDLGTIAGEKWLGGVVVYLC